MNSVNWAGNTESTPVLFKLTWELPNGNEKDGSAVIPIGEPGVHTGLEVATALVNVWQGAHQGGPHVLGLGTNVNFITVVTKVELSDDDGTTWAEIPSDGSAEIVPGNEGLCVWRA